MQCSNCGASLGSLAVCEYCSPPKSIVRWRVFGDKPLDDYIDAIQQSFVLGNKPTKACFNPQAFVQLARAINFPISANGRICGLDVSTDMAQSQAVVIS